MDRGAWWATAHGVTKSLTRLSTHAGAHSGTCTAVSLERLQMLSSIESLNRGFLLKSPILPTPTCLTLLVEEDFNLEMKREISWALKGRRRGSILQVHKSRSEDFLQRPHKEHVVVADACLWPRVWSREKTSCLMLGNL